MYMTDEEYIQKEGQECPRTDCDGAVSAEGFDPVSGSLAVRACWCDKCGEEWTESYTLSGIELVE